MRREPGWVSPVRWVVLGSLAVFAGLPLFAMATTAVQGGAGGVTEGFRWLPASFSLQAFSDVWHTIPLEHYFANSVIVSGSATAIAMLCGIPAAYSLSRFRFAGRRLFSVAALSTQMMPGIFFVLPLFLVFVDVGEATGIPLYQSRLGLTVTDLTFALPFAIWMSTGYFDTIPREIEEAAIIHGCGTVGAMFRVVLPAARPGMVAVSAYVFMASWGEVLFASVLSDRGTRTLAVGLQEYAARPDVSWNQVMAAALLVSAPIVVAFLLLRRYLAAGFSGMAGS